MSRGNDAVLGLFFVCVGLLALWLTRDLSSGTAIRMGAGYFPRMISIAIGICGVALIVKSFFQSEKLERWAWFPLVTVLFAIVVFALTLERLGLVVAVVLLMSISSLAMPGRRWREVLLLAAFASAGAWLLFGWGLGLPLKIWPF